MALQLRQPLHPRLFRLQVILHRVLAGLILGWQNALLALERSFQLAHIDLAVANACHLRVGTLSRLHFIEIDVEVVGEGASKTRGSIDHLLRKVPLHLLLTFQHLQSLQLVYSAALC